MKAYEVVRAFSDLHDGLHVYMVGEKFPRHGATASEKRISELLGSENACGHPLIAEVPSLSTNEEPYEAPEATKEVKVEDKPSKRATSRKRAKTAE